MKYRAEIDGLRALAVLPVILFHAGFEWFSGGFVGVDVFFVISGYLITTIIISEMAEGKFSIVNFYERRARRILPALFFVMAACLPFAWLWLTPNDLKDFGQSLVAVSTFSSNILFWLESGYFDTAAELKPLLHTWSLAVEEQYYILFPIFLMLTWRLGIKWILILLSIAFFISLGIAQWGAYNSPTAAFFLLPTRGWELLVGVFAAFYLKYNTHLKSHSLNQALSLLGFCLIVYSIIAFDETTPFPSLYALVPTIGTGLLILCAVPNTFIHKLLSLKFIVGIGLVSYSAYLWHQPLLAFARHRLLGDISDLILIALCMTSLVMAWFSWKFVEGPFRNKHTITRNKVFVFSMAGIGIFCSLGLSVILKNGYGERVNFTEELMSSFERPSLDHCFDDEALYEKSEWGCVIGKKKDTIDYIIFGDSHALSLKGVFDEIGNQKNISFFFTGLSACLPLMDIHYPKGSYGDLFNCQALSERVRSFAIEKNTKGIILSARWAAYTDGYYDGSGLILTSNQPGGIFSKSSSIEAFEQGFNKSVDFFKANKMELIVISQPPHQAYSPEKIYFHANIFGIDISSLSVTKAKFESLMRIPNSIFFSRSGEYVLIDPLSTFCDVRCDIGGSDLSYYYDADHLSSAGALKLKPVLIEAFE